MSTDVSQFERLIEALEQRLRMHQMRRLRAGIEMLSSQQHRTHHDAEREQPCDEAQPEPAGT